MSDQDPTRRPALTGEPVDPAGGAGWGGAPSWSGATTSGYGPATDSAPPAYAPSAYTPSAYAPSAYAPTAYAPPPAFAPPEYRGLLGAPPAPTGVLGPAGPPADLRPSWSAPGYTVYTSPGSGRRRMWWAIAGLAAVLVAAIALVSAGGGSSGSAGPSQRALALPGAADGYQQLTDTQSQNLVDQVRDRIAGLSGQTQAVFDQALIGLYSRTAGDPEVVFVGVRRDSNTATRHLFASTSAGDAANSILSTAGAENVTSYPSGPLGGSLDCGALPSAAAVSVCVWFDDTTFGLLLDVSGQRAAADLAVFTVDFRGLAEH